MGGQPNNQVQPNSQGQPRGYGHYPPASQNPWGPPVEQPSPQLGWSLSNPDRPGMSASGWTMPPGASQPPGFPGAPQQPPAGAAPLGQQHLPRVSIDDYALPRSNSRLVLAIVGALVIAGLVSAAILTSRRPPTVISPPPSIASPTTTGPSEPTIDPSSKAVPFTSAFDDARGIWEIKESRWTDRGLEIIVKVQVTEGSMRYNFFLLDNKSVDDYVPEDISDPDALKPRTLDAGQEQSGRLVFRKSRGDSMVYLTDSRGRQISALAAKA